MTGDACITRVRILVEAVGLGPTLPRGNWMPAVDNIKLGLEHIGALRTQNAAINGAVQLTLYGLGSMLGSGIYGVIGHAAGVAGNTVRVALRVAMIAALLTALSYTSLGSRYPRAGGAAFVTESAFGMPLRVAIAASSQIIFLPAVSKSSIWWGKVGRNRLGSPPRR